MMAAGGVQETAAVPRTAEEFEEDSSVQLYTTGGISQALEVETWL